MKYIILGLGLFFTVLSAQAQMSKEEAKEWKSKMKALTPEEYKRLTESEAALNSEVAEKTKTVEDLQAENADLMSDLETTKAKLEEVKATEPAPTEQVVAEENYSSNYEQPVAKGIVFKVQIGAFKSLDLKEYFGNHPNFSGEVDDDGTMKYTLGQFSDYWEADKFKKYLRNMGVKGAWIVSYKNGKRVDIKDALEGAI